MHQEIPIDSAGCSQEEAMPEVNVDHVVPPLLKSFFKRLTAVQWESLKAGRCEGYTSFMLIDLTLNIIRDLAQAIGNSLENTADVSEDLVKSILGDTISESFAKVLYVEDPVQCPSSAVLTGLIAREVAVKVQNPMDINNENTPATVSAMVIHSCKMCKAFIGKMEAVFAPRSPNQRTSLTTSQKPTVEPEPSDADDHPESPTYESEDSDADDHPESPTHESEPSDADDHPESRTHESEDSDVDDHPESLPYESEDSYADDHPESPTYESEDSDSDDHPESPTHESEDSDSDDHPESPMKRRLEPSDTDSWSSSDTNGWPLPLMSEVSDSESSEEPEITTEPVLEIARIQSVAEVLRNELNEIIEPFLDDVPDFEYELLQSQSSQEIEDVAEDIVRTLAVDMMEATNPADSNQTEKTHKNTPKKIGRKIRTLLSNNVCKACVHSLMAQMNEQFPQYAKVATRKSVQSHTEEVYFLLKKRVKTNDRLQLAPNKPIPSGQVVKLREDIVDLLYNHMVDEPRLCRQGPVPQKNAAMFAELQKRVADLLAMSRWWQTFQTFMPSERARRAIMGTEPEWTSSIKVNEALATAAKPCPVSVKTRDGSAQDATPRKEMQKKAIEIFMGQLLLRILEKARIKYTCTNTNEMVESLIERTWAEVQEVDFEITPETFKNLDKTIFQDLLKKWGSAEGVLVSLKLGELELGDHIIYPLKSHLMKPPKQSCSTCRFFSSLGRAFSSVCRCMCGRGRVGVM
ncbi:uncharacterized protein LOC119479856 [Sebastes umbrosus]|uniref:uncharacterized protein LOC119479856 n=1 Tax=Sebastes umbrosus TaxID=72105 RepID=UPI0018A0BCB9|nr:uncharacterized protein LOC119479856 [Sebastes umbrosus]